MDGPQATRTADVWLFEAWAARERARFRLPPSALALEPGDVVALEHAGLRRLLRITGIGDRGEREIEAQAIDPEIYLGGPGIDRSPTPTKGPSTGPVEAHFLDLPLLKGTESETAGYVVAAREPWSGAAAFYRSPESTGYVLSGIATRSAVTGVLLDPLDPGPEGRIDFASAVRVRLDAGALSSVTRLAMLGGANAAAIQTSDGLWEVVQFEQATLVAPSTYRLSVFLRGQAGTEDAMRSTIAAGARFVLLDEALLPLPLSLADLGLPLNWRYGPSSRDIGDASYRTQTHAFRGRGLVPLSPAHLRASRAGGDLHLTWVRRTRIGGDGWNAPEVPLGEEEERYEVDILSGSTVVRTIASTTPAATYTAADQVADFGAVQPAVAVRIAQLSATVGRGTERFATL